MLRVELSGARIITRYESGAEQTVTRATDVMMAHCAKYGSVMFMLEGIGAVYIYFTKDLAQALAKKGTDVPLIAKAAQEGAALMEDAAEKITELAASTAELALRVNNLTNEHSSAVNMINSTHEKLTHSLEAQGATMEQGIAQLRGENANGRCATRTRRSRRRRRGRWSNSWRQRRRRRRCRRPR